MAVLTSFGVFISQCCTVLRLYGVNDLVVSRIHVYQVRCWYDLANSTDYYTFKTTSVRFPKYELDTGPGDLKASHFTLSADYFLN